MPKSVCLKEQKQSIPATYSTTKKSEIFAPFFQRMPTQTGFLKTPSENLKIVRKMQKKTNKKKSIFVELAYHILGYPHINLQNVSQL